METWNLATNRHFLFGSNIVFFLQILTKSSIISISISLLHTKCGEQTEKYRVCVFINTHRIFSYLWDSVNDPLVKQRQKQKQQQNGNGKNINKNF